MKIGILATSVLTEKNLVQFGDLPSMFATLLSGQDSRLDFETFDVCFDVFPASSNLCDAWIVTGSPRSAYEKLPWMVRLEDFIRQTIAANIPMVGFCFGHQIMAQAMGGTVAKEANKEWGIAVHNYQVMLEGAPRPKWMDGEATSFALQASHEDQVTALSSAIKRIGGNAFCPNGLLLYGKSGLSMQLHPELSAGFISELIDMRRGRSMSDEEADAALTQVDKPVDDQMVARWIVNFMRELAA